MSEFIKSNNVQFSGGTFGLERETLRVTAEGNMSHTPHPFPDDFHIVKDFCENQAEINTGVHDTAQGAVNELIEQSERLKKELEKRREALWLYSNPPYIRNAEDIPVALYEGKQQGKHSYRLYLAKKYGKYKMTLSGIHVNYSLSEKLLQNTFPQSSYLDFTEYKNSVYLRLAQGLIEYGWIINLLMSASPVCDGSYFSPQRMGETVMTEYASVRCGKEGYWNDFIPILCYDNIFSYAESIQSYINSGKLAGAGELYYPVRLKPKGANRLNNLVQSGVNHIELRSIDINPFAEAGLNVCDLQFIELFIFWLYSEYSDTLSENDQIRSVENFKNAALYDIDSTYITFKNNRAETLRTAGLCVLSDMKQFYKTLPYAVPLLNYQYKKLTKKKFRYAERTADEYSAEYVRKFSKSH